MRFTLATILALGAVVIASPAAELETRHNNNDNVNTSTWCCNGKSWTQSKTYSPNVVLQGVSDGSCNPMGINAGTAWFVSYTFRSASSETDALRLCSSTQVVKCDHIDQKGLVNVGCVPVNV